MSAPEFFAPVSRQIWDQKYRLSDNSSVGDASLSDTFWRVARAGASVERGGAREKTLWAERFFEAMASMQFVPGGRILAGAGSGQQVTLFNCFVLGAIGDDLGSIFDAVKEAALTMQAGGGIGHDFSTLRPRGALVHGVGADASGPVSFMNVWDAMCRTILSAGQRRGAMMGTLRCDHPDIEEFIAVKSDPLRLRNFNLSVLVTNAFMAAVKASSTWDLVFGGKVYRRVEARSLWDKIVTANYDSAEPGVIFIDRVNAMNNLGYCEQIRATNPCGEQPLPPYGACLLGSINLAALVTDPFTSKATIDMALLRERVRVAVRFLDNIIDVSLFPLPQQKREAKAKRRIGLGIMGLADALIMLGLRYGSRASLELARAWMAAIQETAYLASAELAAEKGMFACFDRAAFLSRPNVEALGQNVRRAIERDGMRNGCLTSIAPTGTIALLAGNVSSGIEPVFDFEIERRIRDSSGSENVIAIEDYAIARYRALQCGALPEGDAWVTAADLSPREHIAMQAALQPHVDSAISKTVNCPAAIDFSEFRSVYLEAYELGLKGCTMFRPNGVTGSVLSLKTKEQNQGEAAASRFSIQARDATGATRGASASCESFNGGLAGAATGNRGQPGSVVSQACPNCHGAGMLGNRYCRVCLACGYEVCA